MPTLEERPAESRAVLSSVFLETGTKLHLVPTPEERPARSSVVSSLVCLNAKATSPYLLHLVPTTEERPTVKQCSFFLNVSKHQGDQCTWCPRSGRGLLKACFVLGVSKHQDDQGLGVYAQGEGFPKDSASPIWCVSAPRHLTLHCSELPFCPWCPCPREAPPRLPSRCLNTKVVG